ncbi:MAG: hypothetical protein NTW50_04235 [Candidatus Berkelbacteria bacterium]|nr:hypothetical protein [Candidatus Berkelbacteria bacterium]
MVSAEEFSQKFQFRQDMHLHIGIEQECFLARGGVIAPIAPEIVPAIKRASSIQCIDIGYELSAYQLEHRIGPVKIKNVREELRNVEARLKQEELRHNFKRIYTEVAPDNLPLDVYPDPAGRYQALATNMPLDVLRAACQVAGTHIHIGMADKMVAIPVYNRAVTLCQELIEMGDNSNGKRMSLYRKVAGDSMPPRYNNWNDFYKSALKRGFADNPRNCWDLIRISKHGTIEFRMFGATCDPDLILKWAAFCRNICAKEEWTGEWWTDHTGHIWSATGHG